MASQFSDEMRQHQPNILGADFTVWFSQIRDIGSPGSLSHSTSFKRSEISPMWDKPSPDIFI